MGIMGTYCGIIYNEFFAFRISFFNSCYHMDKRVKAKMGEWYYEKKSHDCTYTAGFDPVWGLTSNGLTFNNSIKMKISVIIGIAHMTIGIIIKGTNAIYFKRWAELVFEVIGGLIILLGLFGFMNLLIFAKWFHNLDIQNPDSE